MTGRREGLPAWAVAVLRFVALGHPAEAAYRRVYPKTRLRAETITRKVETMLANPAAAAQLTDFQAELSRLRLKRRADRVRGEPAEKLKGAARDEIAPTAERQRAGVDRPARPIRDIAGKASNPFLGDTIALMWGAGSLTAAQKVAADQFRNDWRLAQIAPLKAVSLEWMPSAPGPRAPLSTMAQADGIQRVAAALRMLGGSLSPAGSCVAQVVGEEWTLRAWARWYRMGAVPVSERTASTILKEALLALAEHYGIATGEGR